ncbi:aspartate aminotransferase [Arthroderma uncinatum]|uniref:aspartate aminotransferase n=1 Tax=Arthroderma uncinatum TaxID=74035 RepID=UPI00144A9B38|nr:aspartate aminotransferase [Arthroderma uncinatum]KAF3482906.1 aspartate aminotransferase [Arthroderma uncinatum]
MAQIEYLAMERWIDSKSAEAKYDLSSSCAKIISIQDLTALSEDKSESNEGPLSTQVLSRCLGYGEMAGSTALRSTLAGLYSVKTPVPLPIENVTITSGASLANYLVFQALCKPDDHVIVHYPTYQLLYSVPQSLGADVTLWKAKEDDKWKLDVEELKGLIKPNTKMIVLNNPQNPTGAIIPRTTLKEIIAIAREHSIVVFSNEIFRPLFHSVHPGDEEFPPSVLSLGYDDVIVTGSMSKVYSLPGIRVGWIASRNKKLIDQCTKLRSYTTISVSQLDEAVAAYALDGSCLHALLKRNTDLARQNLALLVSFIEKYKWACEWVKPVASSVAFVKFAKMGKPVDDLEFCAQLLQKKGVLLVPGAQCFGPGEYTGYVRVGYAIDAKEFEAGLDLLKEFMEEEYENIPLAGRKLAIR